MPRLLADSAAVVTGAASGIGRAIAVEFARHGCDVVVADVRREPRIGDRTTVEVVERETDAEAAFVTCDVTDLNELRAAVAEAREFGGVDVMVNNAGIERHEEFTEVTEEDYHAMMDVNAKAVFFGSQAAAREMLDTGAGSIINISSISGLVGSKISATYSASKGAVRLMTYSIAAQLGPEGIRANVIHPGVVDTAMLRHDSGLEDDEERAEQYKSQIPLRTFGDPEDVANAAVFLASDMSKYVTAESLVVDGGWWHSR